MNGYLMDTDTCIEILRGNEQVIRRRRGCYCEVVTTEITASELYFGAARSIDPPKNRKQVDRFLSTLKVMPMGYHGAQFFGVFKAALKTRGDLIPDADLWIASVSCALNVRVVTGNGRHLARVPGVEIEDWIHG